MKIFLLTIKILTLLLAAFLLPPGGAFAAQLSTMITTYDDNSNITNQTQGSTTASELNDQQSFTYDFASVHVAYGSCSAFATTSVPPIWPPWQGAGIASGRWDDDVMVNTDTGDTVVLVRFTMHLHGAMSGSEINSTFDDNFNVTVPGTEYGGVHNYSGDLETPGYTGTPIGDLETFTYDMSVQPGVTFTSFNQLGCSAGAVGDSEAPQGPTSGNATCDMQLTCGAIAVYNTATNPINFTAEMHLGSACGSSVVQGGSYSGFTLHNSAPGRVGSTMSVLDGTASAPTQVRAAFLAPPDLLSPLQIASDGFDFQGTQNDPVVLQVGYDIALAQQLFGGEDGLRLAWFNSLDQHWQNAVTGNTGGTPHFFARAYNPATDFQVGNYGLDKVNKVVWAVINHNSEFGVSFVPMGERILSITRPTSSTIRLQCLGEPGALNRIESSPDLNPNHFTTLLSIRADPTGAFQYDDPISSTNKFYRLVYP
jgi:hypothetical protein